MPESNAERQERILREAPDRNAPLEGEVTVPSERETGARAAVEMGLPTAAAYRAGFDDGARSPVVDDAAIERAAKALAREEGWPYGTERKVDVGYLLRARLFLAAAFGDPDA